jgi:hypothetical protein
MVQMNSRVVRVDNEDTAGDDFDCEGIDSTLYGTYSSGASAQVITFGTSLGTIAEVSASGGGARTVEASTIHTNQIIQRRVAVEPFEMSFDSYYDLSDASLLALKTASDAGAPRAVKITFDNGNIVTFYADITAALIPTGGAFDMVKTSITMNALGLLTAYAS